MDGTSHDAIVCPLTREGLTIHMTARELPPGTPTPLGWAAERDAWLITFTSDYPGEWELPFFMGHGYRKDGEPQPPTAAMVLASIGMDLMSARDMPEDDAEACDHMQAEGTVDDMPPGDVLRLVRALRKTAADVREFLRHTGVDPEHFAEWCAGLDS